MVSDSTKISCSCLCRNKKSLLGFVHLQAYGQDRLANLSHEDTFFLAWNLFYFFVLLYFYGNPGSVAWRGQGWDSNHAMTFLSPARRHGNVHIFKNAKFWKNCITIKMTFNFNNILKISEFKSSYPQVQVWWVYRYLYIKQI